MWALSQVWNGPLRPDVAPYLKWALLRSEMDPRSPEIDPLSPGMGPLKPGDGLLFPRMYIPSQNFDGSPLRFDSVPLRHERAF